MTTKFVLALVVVAGLLAGCGALENPAGPKDDDSALLSGGTNPPSATELINPEPSSGESSEEVRATPMATTTAVGAPSISGVTGVQWNWDRAPKYRYYLQVDSYRPDWHRLTITGTRFGSQQGRVSIGGFYVQGIRIIEWSEGRIVVEPKGDIYSTPNSTATLTVTTATGQQASTTAKLVPSIKTRVYGQCTWWAAYRRTEEGYSIPEPSAYSPNVTVTADYVPTQFDVLMWGTSHQAFVENVAKSVVSDDRQGTRVVQYTVRLSQYNAQPPYGESRSDYTTTVRVRESYDRATGQVRSRSFVTGYGGYRFTSTSRYATGAYSTRLA